MRRTVIDFFLMCIVCFLGVAPAYPLDITEINYQPVCAQGALKATPGNTGTTYDGQFQSMMVDSVKVPILLGIFLSVSSGVTNATIQAAPCPNSIQNLMSTVVNTTFPTPLKNQVKAFNAECYLPAKAMFDQRAPDPSTYTDTMDQYGGASDLNWIGSHTLQLLYYGNMSAKAPVPNFPYNSYPSQTVNYNVSQGYGSIPQYGYPTCNQWWNDPHYGLQQQIVNTVDKNVPSNPYFPLGPVSERVVQWLNQINAPMANTATAYDVISRTAVSDPHAFPDMHLDVDGGILTGVANVLVTVGQLKDNLFKEPMDKAKAEDILPIVQAMTLFLVLMLFPIVMVAGSYRLSVFMMLSMLLFGLIFTSAMWQVLTGLREAIDNSISYWNFQNPETKPVLNNFFTILYFLCPAIFNSLLGGAGFTLGSNFTNAIKGSDAKYNPSAGSSDGSGGTGGIDGGAKNVGKAVVQVAKFL